MTAESQNAHSGELGPLVHIARLAYAPVAAVAAVLTVLHNQAVAFSVGATVAWLFAVFSLVLTSAHRWDVCSLCDRPPRVLATPERRARLARRVHSKWRHELVTLLLFAVLAHALLPKPYLDAGGAKVAAAVIYLFTAVVTGRDLLASALHRWHHDECHVDWCRAGNRRPRKASARDEWLGHNGVWLLPFLAPAACVLGIRALHHGDANTQALYVLALIALLLVVLGVALTHTNTPCFRCARHLPSNGGESAERYTLWLRLFHRLRYVLPSVAALGWISTWVMAGTAAGRITLCVSVLLLVPWAILSRVHGRVQPWCPWCRDNGGDSEHEDTPDPSRNQPAPA